MYTNMPGKPSCKPVPGFSMRACVAILAIGTGWGVPARSQTSPNWGGDTPQTRPGSADTTSSSPWGATGAPATIPPRHSGQLTYKAASIPPALAELLKRPDTDVISLTNGQNKTVRDIRAEVNAREAVVKALKTGDVPPGRKRVRVGVFRSPQRDELLNASKLMKDTARRESGATLGSASSIATPVVTSGSHAGQGDPSSPWGAPNTTSGGNGQRDPAAAWATPKSTSQVRAEVRSAATGTTPGSTSSYGNGTTSMRQSGAVFVSTSKPGLSSVSKQPSDVFVDQSTPPGIAIVNGHSRNLQFTPGGLYTIVGKGFGTTVGQIDLIGPHLPGGRLGLQVTQWDDRQLQAQLPEPVSGLADQPVTLRVTTRTGTLFTMDVQFYATRQSISLTGQAIPDLKQMFQLQLGGLNDWNETLAENGMVTRTKSGNNINCPSIGKDLLTTRLPPGWVLVEIAVNSWLPAQSTPDKDFFNRDGDTVVSGSYDIAPISTGSANQIFEVNWGVLRSHSTNGISLIPIAHGFTDSSDFQWTGNDGCVSSYDVDVTLVGPAGMRPF